MAVPEPASGRTLRTAAAQRHRTSAGGAQGGGDREVLAPEREPEAAVGTLEEHIPTRVEALVQPLADAVDPEAGAGGGRDPLADRPGVLDGGAGAVTAPGSAYLPGSSNRTGAPPP